MTENPIAQRLLELAKARGMKRADIPSVTGVSKDRLDNLFKRPGAKPNQDDLRLLAAGLETTPQFIMFGGDPPTAQDALLDEVRARLLELTEAELRMLAAGLRRPPASNSPWEEQ